MELPFDRIRARMEEERIERALKNGAAIPYEDAVRQGLPNWQTTDPRQRSWLV